MAPTKSTTTTTTINPAKKSTNNKPAKADVRLPTNEDASPPTKQAANGNDVNDFWKVGLNLSFVYNPDAQPRNRLLKLLNPGTPGFPYANGGEPEFDNMRCRAIRYLFYQRDKIDIDQGWDQPKETWWHGQTAVHFAAQCSRACLEQLALCWGPEKVGEIAASYTAHGHNALHLAAHKGKPGCVKFLLEGEVGTAFLDASKKLCTSLAPHSVLPPPVASLMHVSSVGHDADDELAFCPHGVNAFTLNVRRVEWENNLIVHCEGIRTDTALSIAADHGHTSVVKTLLDANADPNQYVAGPIRTKRCKFFRKQNGHCPNGTCCPFAHNDSDLGMPRPGSCAVVPYVSAIRSFITERKAARDRISAAAAPPDNVGTAATEGVAAADRCSKCRALSLLSSNRDAQNAELCLFCRLTETLSLLAERTQREHMQRAVSVLLEEELQSGAPSLILTKLWAANLLDVEPKYDCVFVMLLAGELWPQLVAGEADATTEIFWSRLQANPALAVTKGLYPDTLATLAIRVHRLRHMDDPRGQTCTLLTELLKRFPGCASTAIVDVEVTPKGDQNQPHTLLNIAVEYMNCAAVEKLLALDPPASFLTLDGRQCSAVGTAIAKLKKVKEGLRPHAHFLQALGTIITAFAERAEASSPPDDWADIRAPIVATVGILEERFGKEKDRQKMVAPWRLLLSLWPGAAPLGSLPASRKLSSTSSSSSSTGDTASDEGGGAIHFVSERPAAPTEHEPGFDYGANFPEIINKMLEAPEPWSAAEHCAFLENLGSLAQFDFPNADQGHMRFIGMLNENNRLLDVYKYNSGGNEHFLLPRLQNETDEAYIEAAQACELTLGQAGATASGLGRTRSTSECLRCVRNLVAHSGEEAYLHKINWDKARLRSELGNRFSKLAVSLADDFQKAREEKGDNALAAALRCAQKSIAMLRRLGAIPGDIASDAGGVAIHFVPERPAAPTEHGPGLDNGANAPEISKKMLEAPELWSAAERCVFLENLGSLVKQKFDFPNADQDHLRFMRMLENDCNNRLLDVFKYNSGGNEHFLLPLQNETDEAYIEAAQACELTLGQAGATASGLGRTRSTSECLRCVRNLVAHSGEKAYLHQIGWDKARLRSELGNRFSKLAVSLADDFQKAREEGGDYPLRQAQESIAIVRRLGAIQI